MQATDASKNKTLTGNAKMTKTQMIAKLQKMQIADAVDVTYCNVLKSYELKVWLNEKCINGKAKTRESVVKKAEQWYCELISRSY